MARLGKLEHDSERQSAVLLGVALRYQMATQPTDKPKEGLHTRLLTTRPLDVYQHQEKITFMERTPAGQKRDKIVTGYLQSYGTQPIRYLAAPQMMVSQHTP